MKVPSLGRIVHYVLESGPGAGEHRPAIVVYVWSEITVNLQVFTDSPLAQNANDQKPPVMWKASISQDEEDKRGGTWHWPERE